MGSRGSASCNWRTLGAISGGRAATASGMRRTGCQIYWSTSSLTPKLHKSLIMVREYHVVLNTKWNGKTFKTCELTCGLYSRCVLDHLGRLMSILWCHLPELESWSFQRVLLHTQVSLLPVFYCLIRSLNDRLSTLYQTMAIKIFVSYWLAGIK